MTSEKFKQETITLIKFYECYCKNKHKNQKLFEKNLKYKNQEFNHNIMLCEECINNLNYCFNRLQECPHEEKPRCRKCPNPCYEKTYWKYTAKVMRYSGIKLGILKILNISKNKPHQ